MNNQFDELTKNLAQSVTRRAALKKFGVGLAGVALAAFGLANKVEAKGGQCLPLNSICHSDQQCCSGNCIPGPVFGGLGIKFVSDGILPFGGVGQQTTKQNERNV